MKNLAKAGELDIGGNLEPNSDRRSYATVSEYIHPQTDEAPVIEKDPEWYGKHIRESQYLLQI